ncbi:hypothetical protein OAL69_01600 [Pelagibacteraceae bacterium]|jgi:hypothetical protein|nr:hypothetical protein [Pelagibacteraceae bacterium]MDC1148727.1 hypothetical protein [Pelagibacteraceae bacterium]|tara:strand:+ start:16 stop:678 length:663 start_codon:yes stop_codon:yes gene_type:complete
MSILNSVKNSKHGTYPFRYWEVDKPLSEEMINELYNAKLDDPTAHNIEYDGTRAIDGGDGKLREGDKSGGKALKFRCFVSKENEKNYPEILKLVKELQTKETSQAIGNLIGKDLSNAFVRVEICCDRKGFWLKPHCDIKEKLMSSMLFVNRNNESEELGTDFYNEKMEKVYTVPYKDNYGYMFTTDENSWHGLEKKEIKDERRCLQVNYVTFPTDYPVEK